LYHFAKVLGTYLKATEKKDRSAMKQIGELYLAGRFVPKDNAEAYYWFNQAAKAGAPGAASERDKLKASLPAGRTPSEEDQGRVREGKDGLVD
jgi:hypothetical protein